MIKLSQYLLYLYLHLDLTGGKQIVNARCYTQACVCVCVQMTRIPYPAAETVMETVKGHKDSMSAVMDFASK